jgi:uncharacterized membrane protein
VQLQGKEQLLLSTWSLEEWKNSETGKIYLYDTVTNAVYSHTHEAALWPMPLGMLAGSPAAPVHSVGACMAVLQEALEDSSIDECAWWQGLQ